MPEQRIYYVPPRMVGQIDNWSGAYNTQGKSWLLDHVADLGFNALWFSPFCQTTAICKEAHGQTLCGSYYAIRDHFKVDPEFSTGNADKDDNQLRYFCAEAKKKNIRVYADLVFNHVAADHWLVEAENNRIAECQRHGLNTPTYAADGSVIGLRAEDGSEIPFLFKRNADFSLIFGGPDHDKWTDVAQINYNSPAARAFFIDNKDAYFKRVVDWFIDRGFTGFRCDAAYLVPAPVWQEIIGYAKQKSPDALFMAETLGGPPDQIEQLSQARITGSSGRDTPAFDMGMLGIYWWDFQSHGIPYDDHPRGLRMSKFGGAGSPDTHDTDQTLAKTLRQFFNNQSNRDTDRAVADASVRDYAVSTLACNSSYMQMGYEYCNEKQNRVFKGMVTPGDWETLQKHAGKDLDISSRIRAINKLKENLGVDNCHVHFKECSSGNNGRVLKLHCEYIDIDTRQKKADVILLLNKKPENGPVLVTDPAMTDIEFQGWQKNNMQGFLIKDFAVYHTPLQQSVIKHSTKIIHHGPK